MYKNVFSPRALTRLGICFAMLMQSYIARADCAKHYCYPVTLAQVYAVADSSLVYVATSADESQLTSCTPVGGVFLTLDASKVGGNRIYATLLTALATGKTVSIVPVSGSSDCSISYVQIFP